MSWGSRFARWWRWTFLLWTDAVLVLAIMAAAGAPAMLAVTGDYWRSAAEDEVAARIIERQDLDAIGLNLSTEALFVQELVEPATTLVQPEISRIERLGPVQRSFYTLPLTTRADDEPITRVRLVSAVGVLDAAGVANDHTPGGVWISEWLAERFDLGVGDELSIEGTLTADVAVNDVVAGGGTQGGVIINGTYPTVWSEDAEPAGGFWQTLPPVVIPRWVAPFSAPNFAMVITDETTVAQSGLSGIVRWRAPVVEPPTTTSEARSFERSLARFDRVLTQPGPLAEAFARLSGPTAQGPKIETGYDETMDELRSATRTIGPPMRASQLTGLLIGLLTVAAIGPMLVDRRRNEFRLLAGEGDRWIRLAFRAGGQLLLPIAVGTGLGVLVGNIFARTVGPGVAVDGTSVQWLTVVAVGATGLVAASLLAGQIAQGTVESDTRRRLVAHPATAVVGMLTLGGLSALLWVQAGEPVKDGTAIGLGATLLPVAALATAVWILFGVLRGLLGISRAASSRLPITLLLASRRLLQRSGNTRLAVGLLGIGFGLLAFSMVLDAARGRTVEVRLATEVGGVSAFEATGEPSTDLPDRTTELLLRDTQARPGNGLVRVIAVSPGWEDAVSWPDDYGIDRQVIVETLRARGDVLAAVAIGSEDLPRVGAFGRVQTHPYEVMETVRSLPRAGVFGSTLLISAEALDELAAARAETAGQLEGHRSPSLGFRRVIISQLDLPEIEAWADARAVNVRNGQWASVEQSRPDLAATRFAFDFIRVVGMVAALVGAAALVLQLRARGRQNALGGVMLRAMGLSRLRSTGSVVAEVVVSTTLAALLAVAISPVLVGRLSTRFDPSPGALPAVRVLVPWAQLVTMLVGLVLIAGMLALLSELQGARRTKAEVIREFG